MKKLFIAFVVGLMFAFAGCNNTTDEMEAQRIADSTRVADSISLVQKSKVDSIAKMKADSIKADSVKKLSVKKAK